jgi:hypothetical protein
MTRVIRLSLPVLPLAENAPVEGLRSTLFWRGPVQNWAGFVLAALVVVAALALWDAHTRWRVLGPLLLAASGVASALQASSLAAGHLIERCNWGYPYAGLTTGFMRPCVGLYGRYEPAVALGAATLGGTLLIVAALLLSVSSRHSPADAETRRRRLRSLAYF